MENAQDYINFDEFAKISLKVGTVTNCEKVKGSEKLLKLEVDFGDLGKKQILTGMAMYYQPEDFVNLQTVFVFNLAPRKMMGLESQGMLVSVGADISKKPILLKLNEPVENGTPLI